MSPCCSLCERLLPVASQNCSTVVFDGCECQFCCECVCEHLACRSHTKVFRCPHCSNAYTRHTINKASGSRTIVHKKPLTDERTNPYWVWRHKVRKRQPNGLGLLYFVLNDFDGMEKIQSVEVDLNQRTVDDEEKASFIFRKLHPVLVPKKGKQPSPQKCDSITALIDKATTDRSFLLRALFSIGNGVDLNDEQQQSIKDAGPSPVRSDLLACFAAAELLRRCNANVQGNNPQPTALQLAVGSTLQFHGVQQNAIDLLSEFRLSCSWNHLRRVSYRSAHAKMEVNLYEEMNVGPLDLLIHCNDNLDFKGKDGKNPVYTVSTMKLVREQELRDRGFYGDNNQTDAAHRQASWEGGLELMALVNRLKANRKDPFTEIIGQRHADIEALTRYTCIHIMFAMRLDVPSVDQCKDMIDQWSDNDYFCHGTISRNLGVDVHPQRRCNDEGERRKFRIRSYKKRQQPAQDYAPVDSGEHEEEERLETFLSRNNMFLDIPVEKNPGNKKHVKEFLEGYKKGVSCQVSGHNGSDEPIANKFIGYVCDGSPAFIFNTLKDKDAASNANEFKNVHGFPGGFHCKKEIIEKMHLLTGEIVKMCINSYRDTEGRQKHIMFPHDPNDFEEEVIGHTAAMYRSVVEEMVSARLQDSFSAVDVHNYMLERAKECSTAMAVLMAMRCNTIYFMIRDSARSNSPDLFLSAMRLALPIFATTNAYKYVRITVELLVWAATASPAEMTLFEDFCFTRVTTGGKHVFVDQAEEMVNQLVRRDVGKRATPGLPNKLAKCALNLNEKSKMMNQVYEVKTRRKVVSNTIFNESTVGLGISFASVRVALGDTKVWMIGQLIATEDGDIDGDHLALQDGSYLPAELLFCLRIADSRLRDYFRIFYLESRYQQSRPRTYENKGVPFSKIPSSTKEYLEESKGRRVLATSTNVQRLHSAAKKLGGGTVQKGLLIQQVQKLLDQLGYAPEGVAVAPTKRHTGEQLCSMIAICRKLYFEEESKKGQQVANLIELLTIDAETSRATSTTTERSLLLEAPLFSLSQSALQCAEFNEPIEVNV